VVGADIDEEAVFSVLEEIPDYQLFVAVRKELGAIFPDKPVRLPEDRSGEGRKRIHASTLYLYLFDSLGSRP
jgi:hypothetical protein